MHSVSTSRGIHLSGNNMKPVHDNIFRNNIVYNCGLPLPEIHMIGTKVACNKDRDIPTYGNQFLTILEYNDKSESTYFFRGSVTEAGEFNRNSETDAFPLADNIGANPLLKDIENGNYQMGRTSPCRDAGTEPLAILDYYGNPIPVENKPAISRASKA